MNMKSENTTNYTMWHVTPSTVQPKTRPDRLQPGQATSLQHNVPGPIIAGWTQTWVILEHSYF